MKGAGCRDLVGDFVVGLLVGRQRLLLLFDRLVQLVRLGRLPFEDSSLVNGVIELPFVRSPAERRCPSLGPTQSRISPSITKITVWV